MSEKFTKGPWNANFTRFSGWVVGFHITDLEHGSLRPICEAYDKTGAMNPNEIAANARLIAAAPELLEALMGAVAQMSLAADCIENGRFDEALLHIRSLSREKHAAIAKATGEQA